MLDIYHGTITAKEADNDHNDLLFEILNYRKASKTEKCREKATKRRCSLEFI